MGVFCIKRGDTLPVLATTLENPDGTPHIPTGTVLLKVLLPTGLFQRSMTIVEDEIRYAWVAGDWDVLTVGLHRMEFEETPSGGGVITFPNNRYDRLAIEQDLDGPAAAAIPLDGAVLLESGISSKISGLTDGAPAVMTDQVVVGRSGVNRRLTVGEIQGLGSVDRFLGVEYVFYGTAKAGKPAPTGPEILLTAAQFRTINTTPQTLIPAVADRVILPVFVHLRKEAGSAGFVAGPNTGVQLRLGTGTGQQITLNQTLAQMRFDLASEEAHLHLLKAAAAVFSNINLKVSGANNVVNEPLILFGAGGDMASDGSPVHISILAELWPVNVS